jgi:hypothetical protein
MSTSPRALLLHLQRQVQKKTPALQHCVRHAASVSRAAHNKKNLVFDNRSPSLQDFLAQANASKVDSLSHSSAVADNVPYLNVVGPSLGRGRKFYIEVYGCQVRIFVPPFNVPWIWNQPFNIIAQFSIDERERHRNSQ